MNQQTYQQIVYALGRASEFEKQAENGDALALHHKANHAFHVMGLVKSAIDWKSLAQVAGKQVGKGALVGTGAAIPAAGAGAYLINKADEAASRQQEDLRNKALQVALGVGGVSAGLMGVNHLLNRQGGAPGVKQASTDLVEQLATVGYLEAIFEEGEKCAASIDDKEAMGAYRLLNAEHCVHLLQQLLD